MSRYIHKSHNVTVLLCHLVFPAKYRRAVIDVTVDQVLREVCLEIEARYPRPATNWGSWRSARTSTTSIFSCSRCRPIA